MNTRQLQYVIALSRTLNISQAADGLKITQPALSKQILSLEKEIGVSLFDRSGTPLKLTQAGEVFVKQAEEILLKEENLLHSMEDFKSGDRGRLTIGISPFRASYFLSGTIKKLQEKYPGLQIVLKEEGSAELRNAAAEGRVDFAVINLPADNILLDVVPLKEEPLVLVVPKNLEEMVLNKEKEIELSDCKELPFIALGKNQELRKLFDKLCLSCEFTPKIAVEAVGITTAWSLAQAGIGATVLPLRFIEENKIDSRVAVCQLNDSVCIRNPAIVTRKGHYLSKYAKEAINLLKEV